MCATHEVIIPRGIVRSNYLYSNGADAAASGMDADTGMDYMPTEGNSLEDNPPLAHSLETTVRKWGLPTRLVKGKVMLDEDHVLCKDGQVLDSNQTALLKLFGVPMATFRVRLLAYWAAGTQTVTVLQDGKSGEVMDEDEDGEGESG